MESLFYFLANESEVLHIYRLKLISALQNKADKVIVLNHADSFHATFMFFVVFEQEHIHV